MNHLQKNTCIIFLVFIGSLILLTLKTNSQINIFPGPDIDPGEMVELLVGDGILFYDNVTCQSAPGARGYFNNGYKTNIGLESGIFLTSGAGYIIPGPNNQSSAGFNNGTPGNAFLNLLSNSSTYDACVLEFDFIPETDTLQVKYVYGSEEYFEWVGSSYVDVFAFFVNGPNPAGGNYVLQNIALIPGTTIPSFIIDSSFYSQYMIVNLNGLTIQYDGFTVVLTAWLHVVPLEPYHIIIGIADASDGINDSGVLLGENSLISPDHADLISFDFEKVHNSSLAINYSGNVENDTILIMIPSAQFNNLLVATFETRPGTSVFVNGVIQESGITLNDFSSPVWYHVVGWEGSMRDYLVIVPGNENDFLFYAFESENNPELGQDYIAEINGTQITVDLPVISSAENLVASFVLSDEANTFINGDLQQSGITPNDFTEMVIYSVEAENGDLKNYTIDVDIELNSANDILSFGFDPELNPGIEEYAVGIIGESTVDLYLPVGTDILNLIATFTLPIQAEAYVFGQLQVSGITPNDFTVPKIYNVEAGDGSLMDWLVTIHLITGINNPAPGEISVYPNPASDRLIIRNAADFSLKIFSVFGKLISESKADNEIYSLNLESVSKGIYYLQIENPSGREVRKIIVL
jgi:hypothetical protein